MVNLRIKELAEEKGLTLKELSQISSISEEALQAYATKPVDIEKVSDDLKKIAAKLNVPVIHLIKNVAKKLAFKLDILKVMQQKRISLETLVSSSNIHPAVLLFYITQPISNDILAKSPYQDHLKKISDSLEVSPEDLKVVSDLPKTRLYIEESLKEKGLTLEEYSKLMGWPIEFVNLIATQPVDMATFTDVEPISDKKTNLNPRDQRFMFAANRTRQTDGVLNIFAASRGENIDGTVGEFLKCLRCKCCW